MSDTEVYRIPASATTLGGFRAWAASDDFPMRGRISFIDQDIIIDMSPEEFQTHNKVKAIISAELLLLVRRRELGEIFFDRMLLTNEAAGISTEPDAMFVSRETFIAQNARLVPREQHPGEYLELVGTPDWVLEVVSRSSVVKDTRQLRQAYHQAGIPEYWLVDALGKQISFQILQRRRSGYVAVSSRAGWRRSAVFGCEFQLTRKRDSAGIWQYDLAIREE
jgi:Uma2 family endonuclease